MSSGICERSARPTCHVVFTAICVCVLAGPGSPDASRNSEQLQKLAATTGAAPQLDAELVAQVTSPVLVTHAPGDFERLFVPTKHGQIRIIKNGSVLVDPFLDLTDVVYSGGQ